MDPTRFDVDVAPGGYVWWYLDALSDDGAHGLTIIAFIGSVFSPYYAHARHRGGSAIADPLAHCAINVALYGKGANRWSMTERRASEVTRSATRLQIGPSALAWTGDTLTLHLDEVTAPLPRRLRGTIEVKTGARPTHRVALDAQGRHRWGVIAPAARIDVAFDAPRLAWSGSAYLDSNRGSVPLEHDFTRWNWSRGHLADGRTAVVYDIERREGGPFAIADWFDAEGGHGAFEPPPVAPLPVTRWGLARETRSELATAPTIALPLEDGPFYSRSVVNTRWLGQPVTSVHEHLSLQRFDRRWVRALLPFRMPRRFW
ncbi:MAG: carotenoid 1,2-hydratase [Burkholderiaceae bacterium]